MPKTFEDKEFFPLSIEGLTIAEWCPNPNKEDPTEVHLVIELEDTDFSMVVRFKGTEMLDQVIQALIQNRRNVWPDVPKIGEE